MEQHGAGPVGTFPHDHTADECIRYPAAVSGREQAGGLFALMRATHAPTRWRARMLDAHPAAHALHMYMAARPSHTMSQATLALSAPVLQAQSPPRQLARPDQEPGRVPMRHPWLHRHANCQQQPQSHAYRQHVLDTWTFQLLAESGGRLSGMLVTKAVCKAA